MKIICVLSLAIVVAPLESVNHGPHWKSAHVGDTVTAAILGFLLATKEGK